MGECRQQKYTQHAPYTKTECDYLNGWIKKMVTYAKNLTQKVEPQRYSWGTQKKKEGGGGGGGGEEEIPRVPITSIKVERQINRER